MNNENLSNAQPFAEGSDNANSSEANASNGQIASDKNAENFSENDGRNKSEEFSDLISGEYKAEYQSALENALSKRLKTNNKKLAQSEEFRTRLQPVFDVLAEKYSIEDPTDIEAIISAAESERMPDDLRLEREFQNKFNSWLVQADEMKYKYPNFDFEYESTNEETGEQFRSLLNSGVDVESAFTVIHKNEIMGGAMQYAYKTAKQEIADSRTARLNRPTENGVSSHQASAIIDDISKLKPEQRKLIKAAVSRGEKVSAENFRRFL